MKKSPSRTYERKSGLKPFIGTMAVDSHLRKQQYFRNSCNTFEGKVNSRPLSIWTEADIWEYIRQFNLPYSKIYDMGYKNTGCVFCMFGVHRETTDMFNKNKFQLLKETHPKLWKYCMDKLGLKKVLETLKVEYE